MKDKLASMNRTKAQVIPRVAIIGALYTVLVLVFAPWSFMAFQFRLAEILKPIVLRGKYYPLAIGLGNFVANVIITPLGPLDFIVMPLVCIVVGYICYFINLRVPDKKYWEPIVLSIYAIGTSLGVAFVLYTYIGLPYVITFLYVLLPEIILICILGPLIFFKVDGYLKYKY